MKRGVSLAKQTQRKYNRIRELNSKEKKKIFRHKLFLTYSHFGKRNFVSYGKRAARIMQSKQIKNQLKPLFNRLKKEKYVETYLKESSTGPSRKYYHITADGRTAYNQMRQEWDEFSGVINILLKGVDYNEQK